MYNKNKVSFGRVFWPSLIAGIAICIIGALLFSWVIGSFVSRFENLGEADTSATKANTVLHLELNGPIAERSSSTFDPLALSMENTIGLSDILVGLDIAAKDEKVKGLFVEIDGLSCGYATAKEIRGAIDKFEKSGKFVISYLGGEVITLKEYYLSSAANTIYGFANSGMEFLGLATELTFFKNTMEKLDLEATIIRGRNNDFKSAVEPFFLEKMSDSSRLQLKMLLDNSWHEIKTDIASARQLKVEELDAWADAMRVRRVSDAAELKMVDATKYRDEVMLEIAKKSSNNGQDDEFLFDFVKYAKKKVYEDQMLAKNGSPNIAVVLAEGGISVDGDEMSSKDICALIKEARNNKSIKTIVLRVNSPGGSALASDEIWREVALTKKTKKVIVSMGDVAASGGYYIASPADVIFAEPNTITGSIGVFGVIPYTGKMFEKKLGLSFDRLSTNKHQALTTNRKMSQEEIVAVQEEIDFIYDDFLSRVAEGRHMSTQAVDRIARGRVWSGTEAKRLGLVDEIGGLEAAIAHAAKLSKIDATDMKILYYPIKKKDKWEALLQALDKDKEVQATMVKQQHLPGIFIEQLNLLKKWEKVVGIQMRLPFELVIF